jgi:hypothetical protein
MRLIDWERGYLDFIPLNLLTFFELKEKDFSSGKEKFACLQSQIHPIQSHSFLQESI